MIVASSFEVGKADVLEKLAGDLTAWVRQSVREGSSLDELERGVWTRVLGIGRAAVELFLQGQGNGDLGACVTTAEGTVLQRSEGVVSRPLRTIFGEHTIQSYVYSRGSKRKIDLRPIDARLNLPEQKASYLLQEFTQWFCVEKAFGVGAEQFAKVFGQRLSVDVLEDLNRVMGAQAEEFLEQLPTPPAKEEGALLVVTADGKGVPLVKAAAQQVPAFDQKERPGNRRMATLGCVYTVDPHVRTPEQIVAALFRDATVAQPTGARPEPCCKHYRAYFAQAGVDGEEPIPSAWRTWSWLTEEVKTRHRPGQPIVCVMDGQPILWEAAAGCLEEMVEELPQTKPASPPVVEILDILHVSGYVWKMAKVFETHRERQEAFAYARLLRLLQGDVAGVITGLRRMATQRDLKGEALQTVTIACNYFEKHAQRMCYHEYLQAGYPIASGVIEGACRHIIKDRMEQGGMRWTLEGAEAMLNVRAVYASSYAEEFGQWRQVKQAESIHPHRALVDTYKGFTA